MIKFVFSNKEYTMVDDFDYKKSSREVKYSNIKIDFTNLTSSDLPRKYQECKIMDDKKVLFTGFASSFSISDMHLEEDVFRELEIELLSPMAMATVRTCLLKGTYQLEVAINKIIQPLLSDGFVLKECNVNNKNVTVNFILNPIEDALNKLSNTNNIWWYIDENKNIYINDISYQFSKDIVLDYDDKPPHGLYKLEPILDIEDYCNVVNIKNVRVYSASIKYGVNNLNPIVNAKTVANGDTITFSQPVDTTIKNIEKSYNELKQSIGAYDVGEYPPAIWFEGTTSSGTKNFYIRLKNGELDISNNVKFKDTDENKEFEMIKDAFFSNLVTGFKYTGSETITITKVISVSCLKWTNIKFYDNIEIEKQKDIISLSGQVEKTINLNQQWKLMSEVTTIAHSYLDANSGGASVVKLTFDEAKKIDIGDTIRINKPKFLLEDTKYICTDINYSYVNDDDESYIYEFRNKNYLTNYIDLFRAKDEETANDKIETLVISSYIEEGMDESHEVIN